MIEDFSKIIDDRWILSRRSVKNKVDPRKPYGWTVEKERLSSGEVQEVGIIFLTNAECPFHCLMCDLWKNTTDFPVSPGDIPYQISLALEHMPKVKHLKLYNSGSFFDTRAIPLKDYSAIKSLIKKFDTVVVESHPKFIGRRTLEFRDELDGNLEVAIGLETIEPDLIRILNKQMSLHDFEDAVAFLTKNQISSRAFILLKPPFQTEVDAIHWAKRSIDFAFNAGVDCCSVIPVRFGNGAMDELMRNGHFSLPRIESLEKVLEYGINLQKGRVFADTWDLGLFSRCDNCLDQRLERITTMNYTQKISEPVVCSCFSA